ncbi:MAG TPA: hypothetical protein VFH56_11095 [Acidimicrobiales bacterium]|nr:hypothetical protein [Acidimicrobiales bacterium]
MAQMIGNALCAVVIAWAELWGRVTDRRRTWFARVTDEGEA